MVCASIIQEDQHANIRAKWLIASYSLLRAVELREKILVKILTCFDSIELFPHVPGGPIPFLIVDGHQSCIAPMFIEYINDQNHTWKVCLSVPYATTLWQVGDASQNGMVKLEWYREKKELLPWKYLNGLPDDVMPLMNKIYYKSYYNNAANNKKAVAVRGWYPPNMALLEHPMDNFPGSYYLSSQSHGQKTKK